MLTPVCQRWRERRDTYRPAREPFDPRACEVASIPDDTTARAFVEAHHYERTLPPARFRFGLYERDELVGVAVFSVPAQDAVTACLPGERDERTELGRLVLLDRVLANAESWFVARCFDALRREGLTGVVSFSDPTPRTTVDGRLVMPGHIGNVYQALSAVYLGTIYSGTRERLSDADRARVLAMMFARGGEHGVGDCPTGLDAFVRAALIEPPIVFTAEWDRLGKRAGPERNERMVQWAAEREGSILLAFPGPASRGTWDCIRRAVAAGLRVLIEPVGRHT